MSIVDEARRLCVEQGQPQTIEGFAEAMLQVAAECGATPEQINRARALYNQQRGTTQ